MAKRKKYDVSAEKFVEVWQSSETAEEAATRLGMPKPIVLARASNYRAAGIKMKKMPRRSKRELDVDALNRLIERINREREES